MKMEGEVENILEKLEGGRGGKDMHESRNNNSTHLRNHASCVSEHVFGGRVWCEDFPQNMDELSYFPQISENIFDILS